MILKIVSNKSKGKVLMELIVFTSNSNLKCV